MIPDNKIFSNIKADNFIKKNDYANAAKVLFNFQKKSWRLLNNGYESLLESDIKTFSFNGFKIKVQFNKGRIISSSAKVDEASIKNRKCFLCIENLFEEQKGIIYKKKYLIISNPYPIFNEHFTIPSIEHKPQKINSEKNYFTDLLNLSKDLSDYYIILYNGPASGASAPDHFHFQAGTKNFLPVESDFIQMKENYGEALFENDNIVISGIDDGLRKMISFESFNERIIEKIFRIFYEIFDSVSPGKDEPMMNIHSIYDESFGWRVIIFLREKHRSSHYFAEDEKKFLISPGAADLGGLCIVPLEDDYKKISKEIITEIFNEISLKKDKFEYLKAAIKNKFKK